MYIVFCRLQEGRTERSFFPKYHKIIKDLLAELKARGAHLPSYCRGQCIIPAHILDVLTDMRTSHVYSGRPLLLSFDEDGSLLRDSKNIIQSHIAHLGPRTVNRRSSYPR